MAGKEGNLIATSVEVTGEETKKGGGSLLEGVARLLERLTRGFWETVVRQMHTTGSLGTEFLCVLSFLIFSGICTLSSLASVLPGVFPVPMALSSAIGGFEVTVGEKRVSSFGLCASALFGVVLSAFFLPLCGAVLFCLALFFAFRYAASGGTFRERVLFRALFAGVFSVLQTTLFWVFLPELQLNLFSVLFSGIFSGVLALVFSGVFLHALAKKPKTSGALSFSFRLVPSQLELYRFLAAAALLSCAFFALRPTRILALSPALIFACVLTLCVAARRGTLYGVLTAVLLGVGASSPDAALALVFSALAYCGGSLHSRHLAVCASFLSSIGFLLCFSPSSSFALCAADLLMGHLLFFVFFREAARSEGEETPRTPRALIALQEKLSRLSEAFSSLSEVFYMATDASLTPQGQLAERLVREASERVCARCMMSTDCWQQNYGLTQGALMHLSRILAERREISPSDLEPYFKSRCKRAEELCSEINRRYAAECAALPNAEDASALLCGEYGSVARLLSGEAELLKREEEINESLSLRAEQTLKRLGVEHRTAYVFGGRDTTLAVTGVSLSKLKLSTEQLLAELSQSLGVTFDVPEFSAPLSDCTVLFKRKKRITLSCARMTRAAGMQAVSGDTTGFFESDTGYFYSLICDGMGSGRDAAFTSRLSGIFIEKLLTFSREKGVTLEMLNRFLLSRKEERFSTVDLLEVDLYTARANFIKAGAAASYIKRGTGLYRIASKTPPAGILDTLSAEQTSLSLSDGDCIVMFSDGVAPSEESDAWFAEKLAFAKEHDARALASYLMRETAAHRGEATDDRSICVLEVHAA
ncbi:MAG: SpoIIE family protein phosphatase [Clostridia bacterium]|nr:SpoIIE family protein phosphatase [Clostridia bacterium]